MAMVVRGMAAVVTLGFALMVAGCGSASNNDQGVAFLNLGWFGVDDEGVCEEDGGVTGFTFPLSVISEAGQTISSVVGICLGVQNNMTVQFVRTQRVRLEYLVDGAIENPPTTVVAFTVVVGPQAATDTTEGGSTSSFGELPQKIVGGLSPVPAEVRQWMILNRDLLPEPPFTMSVRATVLGITSAGDQLESNPADLFVEVTPDQIITPTDGGTTTTDEGADAAA